MRDDTEHHPVLEYAHGESVETRFPWWLNLLIGLASMICLFSGVSLIAFGVTLAVSDFQMNNRSAKVLFANLVLIVLGYPLIWVGQFLASLTNRAKSKRDRPTDRKN